MRFVPLLLILAQQTSGQPPFKSGVNLVEVDAVVTDRAGRPVRGLRREDFEVLEDGRPVALAAFTAVDLPLAPAGTAIPAADRSGTSTASNHHPDDGRVIVIVLDDYHVGFNAGRMVAAKRIAQALIARLGPSDQAAVFATSGASALRVEFTNDKARLSAAVDKFFPQAESGSPGIAGTPGAGSFGFIHELKARWAGEALSNAAKALAQIQHRRKAVLLVSQGLPASLEEIISNPSASTAWQGLRDFILTAQRSNVAVYPFDPCGLERDAGCSTDSQQNLRTLAESTGGFAVLNSNTPEASVERMIEENGAYYLLGYYSPAPAADGKRHRITVRTRAPGTEVRAREGYFSPRRPARPGAPATRVDALIDAPVQARGLTMRVRAVPAPLAGRPGSTVAIGIELPADVAIRAGAIEFSVVAVDLDGKVRARQRFTTRFQPPNGPATGWTRLGSRVDVAAGRYQIRIAAVASGGLDGSAFTEVVVPKFSDHLAFGGLSLGTPGVPTASRAELLANVLPLLPLATAEFLSNLPLVAQVPVRISAKAAGPLTIEATLVHAGGGTVRLSGPESAPATPYSSPSGGVYHVALPGALAAGSYRLTVKGRLGRTEVSRELVFRVVAESAGDYSSVRPAVAAK